MGRKKSKKNFIYKILVLFMVTIAVVIFSIVKSNSIELTLIGEENVEIAAGDLYIDNGARALYKKEDVSGDIIIDNKVNGEIGKGYLLLLGIGKNDTEETAIQMIEKVKNLINLRKTQFWKNCM